MIQNLLVLDTPDFPHVRDRDGPWKSLEIEHLPLPLPTHRSPHM